MKQSTPDHSDKQEQAIEKRSPHDWAKRLGGVAELKVPRGDSYYSDYRHPMARTIHGWALHEYHEGAPLLLSLEDYQAALKVAESFPYEPHKSAMSKHAPAEFAKAAK